MPDFDDFASQSHRLLRRNWQSPTQLSQEMYAMLSAPEGGSPEVKASTPDYVLDRMQKAMSELTIQQAVASGQNQPGFVPDPPTPLETLE